MTDYMSRDAGSSSGTKKIITICIIIIVVLSFGYYLFKISPETTSTSASGYNGALNIPTSPTPIPAPAAFDPATDHFQGNASAKNVFIEYGDMQCPACAAAEPVFKQVPSQFTDTVFVFRYFPLIQVHQNAVEGALAAEAAGAQGKFWEMHELLFQKQADWESLGDPIDVFAQYAQQVGVANIDQFKSDITSKKYLPAIQKNSDEAYALNLGGTPSIFINGHPLKTTPDIASLKQEAEQFMNK
ncbi:MAG TPA: thioredoxin domain-containing protein [Candidatus Limnocylindria bacterium]|nr:thioredoxin domain-containing protein [Candidatus Limnocylindria bacterium]